MSQKHQTEWEKEFAYLIYRLNTNKEFAGTNNYISLQQEAYIRKFIATLIAEERARTVKILKDKLEDMPSGADDSIYPLIVESRNKLINETLLAITVQDNGTSN